MKNILNGFKNYKKFLWVLSYCLLMLVSRQLNAQSISVRGKITASGEGVQYANVIFKDESYSSNKYSALTDLTGYYQINIPTSIGNEDVSLSQSFELDQNYPNPFNPSTTISFGLPRRSTVNLVLIDMLGREVSKIAGGTYKAGNHKVTLDASGLSSGVYVYRMDAGSFQTAKKLIVIK